MMNNMYRDYSDGCFIPEITVTKQDDKFVASAMGLKVSHYDQAEAVNRLTSQIQDGILKGELHPDTP